MESYFIKLKNLLLVYMIFVPACVPEMDFEAPQIENPRIEIEADTRLYVLINNYLQGGEEIHTFSEAEEIWAQAIVVSSDEAGNFYKRLIVQDVEGPDIRGLSILIDLRSSYAKYPFGSMLYINVEGLSLFGENGSFTLGFRNRDRVEAIPESLLDRFLVRTGIQAHPQTEIIQASKLSEKNINTRVRLKGLQFEREDLGQTYAAEPHDAYNALRPLKICSDPAPLFLSTSVYADFKFERLPESTFELEGLLIREYDNQMALVLNDPDDLKMESESRCDDEFLECEPPDKSGIQVNHKNSDDEKFYDEQTLYYENFEGIQYTRDLEKIGWSNLNSNFSNGRFVKRSENDNTFVRVSAYGTSESVMEAWLISPEIDLDLTQQEYLFFDSRATFNEGRLLSVWISTDYDGDTDKDDPGEATWYRLAAKVSEGSSDGSNEKFISSEGISLDCVNGKARIAFRYLGGDPGPSTNYDLDNILIRGRFQ